MRFHLLNGWRVPIFEWKHRKRLLPEMLPPLRGFALTIYSVVWIGLMAIAIVIIGLNVWQNSKPQDYAWLNYGVAADDSGHLITSVTGAEAVADGIKVGDAIVAVDGVPADRIAIPSKAKAVLARPDGAKVAFTLRDVEGRFHTYRLTRSAANTRDNERLRSLFAGAALAIGAACLCAAMLLFRRRREPVPAILALAFVLCIGPTWQTGAWIDQPWLSDALNVLFSLGLPLMLFGVLVFPDGRMGSRLAWTIAAALVIWTAYVVAYPFTSATIGALGLIAFIALIGARQFFRYRRMPAGIERQQIRWGMLGFAAAGVCVMIIGAFALISERIGPGLHWRLAVASDVIFMLGMVAMLAGLVVSLMRYRLYDAEAAISRSVAYGLLTVALLAIFAGTEKVIELLGEQYMGHGLGALAGGIGAAAAAVMISPLHHRASDWAERRFQKHLLHLRHGLPLLVSDLRETAGLKRLAAEVLNEVLAGVHTTSAALLVDNSIEAEMGVSTHELNAWLAGWSPRAGGALDCDRSDPLFPMRVPLDANGHGRIGWLLLGPRPDGSFFGKDEREVLAEIASPLARAIDVVRTRETREANQETRVSALAERLRDIESLLATMIGGRQTAVE